jgi:branched-chain amino acid transport system substrate-binding protein
MRALRRLAEEDARFGPARCPVLSCNLTECELPALGEAAEGMVSAGPYFRGGEGRFGSSFDAAAYASVRSLAARLAQAGDGGAALDDLLVKPDGGVLAIDPATHHAALPVLIAQVEGGAFRVREQWEAVKADPYLARRERLEPRPHLRAVTS